MGRGWVERLDLVALVGVNAALVVFLVAHQLGIDLWALPLLGGFHDWLYTVEIGLNEREIVYLVMGAGFGFVGLVTVARGVPAFGRAVRLWAKDPVPVGDLHLHSGAVEVEGVAEPMDEYGTVESRYSGTACLAYRFEEKEQRRRLSREDRWRVTERGKMSRPFYVTDETGTVAVDPSGATLTCGRDIVFNSGRTIRTEWRLEPGESVYVSGRKQAGVAGAGPGGATTYVGAGDDAGSFTVSDAHERRTVLRFLAKGSVLSVLGLVFLGAGGYLLYGFGVV